VRAAEDLRDAGVKSGRRSLRDLATKGSFWSLAGYGSSQVLRLVGNLILTRLLFGEAFGLMALVAVLLQGLQLFSDIGIRPNIVQHERGDDPDFLNTAWTLQVGRGAILWFCACLGAVHYARFYDAPLLAWIVPVSGLTALLDGFSSTKLHTLSRHLAVGRMVKVELMSQVVGLLVMVIWALVHRSVWALVAGGVAGSLTKLVVSHAVLPGVPNRFRWDSDAARSIVRFGRWIFLSTIMFFLAGQSDRLIFGKMVPLGMLGIYSIGLMVASMAPMSLSHLVGTVAFPLFSKVVNRGESLVPIFRPFRWPLLLLAGWMLSGLIGGGAVAIDLLYDERYAEAGWIVQLLSVGGWFTVLEALNGAGLLALGKPRWVAASGAAKLLAMLVLIPAGYAAAEFPGAVAGFAAAEMGRYAVSAFAAHREGLSGWPQDLSATAVLAAAAAAGWFTAEFVAQRDADEALVALGVFLAATVVWLPFVLHFLWRIRSAGDAIFGSRS
jgi:O-antigen/teichoic acid export membrane protein